MADECDRKEFLLSALRGASLRARLYEVEINSIGVALKSDMVTCDVAMQWIKDIGALELMVNIPDST
jgi:hypothetical protein